MSSLYSYQKGVGSMNIQIIIVVRPTLFSLLFFSFSFAYFIDYYFFFAFGICHRCKYMRTSTSSSYLFIQLFDHSHIKPVTCSDPDILPKSFSKALLIVPTNF